jgi:hypothetical protein
MLLLLLRYRNAVTTEHHCGDVDAGTIAEAKYWWRRVGARVW